MDCMTSALATRRARLTAAFRGLSLSLAVALQVRWLFCDSTAGPTVRQTLGSDRWSVSGKNLLAVAPARPRPRWSARSCSCQAAV
jgi:hypothetical protein